MAKLILEFDLDTERESAELAVHAIDFLCVLDELDQWLRGYVKYQEESTWPNAETIRAKLWELRSERNLPG